MPSIETIAITITRYPQVTDLDPADQELVHQAVAAAGRAYAPYSHFPVGAALRLSDGRTVTGNNQENAAFPAGTCAERTALHAIMSAEPGAVVRAIAIAAPRSQGERPVPPCGICRQALAEQEQRQDAPLRVLLAAPDGSVHTLASAADLLPLAFGAGHMRP